MRIIFMGSPEFAVPSLKSLIENGHDVVAVVSGEDKKRGRGSALSPTPVKATAQKFEIPIIEAENMRDSEFHEQLKRFNPDLFVVVAFKILPKSVLQIPTKGSINLHASLLPKYRGAAPIHWAVVNGEKETGNTIFFLNEKMDEGNIIAQKSLPIGENVTTGDIYEKLMAMGAELISTAVKSIEEDSYSLSPQNHDLACPAPKVFPDDAFIDFKSNSVDTHNRIRGMNPFPGAWTWFDGQKLKIHKSFANPEMLKSSGETFLEDGKLYVGCEGGCIELAEIQLPGKKRISGNDFALGHDLKGLLQK